MYARMNATSATKFTVVVPEAAYEVSNAASPIYATANAIEGDEDKNQQHQQAASRNVYDAMHGSRNSASSTSNAYDRLGGISAETPASPLLKRKGVVRRKRADFGKSVVKANRPLPAAPAAKASLPRKLSFNHGGGRSGPPAHVVNAAGAAAMSAVANAAKRQQRLQSTCTEEQTAMDDEVLAVCVAMFDYIPPVHQLPML